MNEMKASLLIMSHLSDAQELISRGGNSVKCANEEINFAKFVLLRHPNLDEIVNADELWMKFSEWKNR